MCKKYILIPLLVTLLTYHHLIGSCAESSDLDLEHPKLILSSRTPTKPKFNDKNLNGRKNIDTETQKIEIGNNVSQDELIDKNCCDLILPANDPIFHKNQMMMMPPLRVRLICNWHVQARNFGALVPNRYDTEFHIQYFDKAWLKVGNILTQSKLDHDKSEILDKEVIKFGPHVRIRTIEVDQNYKNKCIKESAMVILLVAYEPINPHFKLEINIHDFEGIKFYKSLGFVEHSKSDGWDDVVHMLK